MAKLKIKDKQTSANEPASEILKEAYATGKRKNAIARVWVRRGTGKVTVNNKAMEKYFPRQAHRVNIKAPCLATNSEQEWDVICTATGGGVTGQAQAIRHGIAKALVILVPEWRPVLRKEELLTRDSRVVERKKFGQHKARKKTQYSKR